MILTLTPNPALDRVLFIPEFQPGERMEAAQVVDCVGGKGFDISVALAGLGGESLAMGVVGGENGQRLANLLKGYGVQEELVWTAGETRLALVIVEAAYGRHSHLIPPAAPLPPAALQTLLSRLRSRSHEADWLAAGGSLAEGFPPDFYAQVVEIARLAGAPILVDSRGPALLACLAARPEIVKLNLDEFCQTFSFSASDLGEAGHLLAAMRQATRTHALNALLVTLGAEGLAALSPQGAYRASCPAQWVVNAAGAGDAVSAGLLWRLEQGDDWEEALRWAAAAGSACVLTPATGEVRLDDALRLLPQVQLTRIEP